MLQLATDPAFRLYIACSVLLVLMMYGTAFYAVRVRARLGVSMNPEDVRFNPKAKAKGKQAEKAEHPEVDRMARVQRNGLENIPYFLVLGLAGVLAGAPLLGLQLCFIGFTVGRFVYTFAYINALQPWRSLSFSVAMLSNVALGVMTLIHVF